MRGVRAGGWCFSEHSEFRVVARERLNDTTGPPDRAVLGMERQIGINGRFRSQPRFAAPDSGRVTSKPEVGDRCLCNFRLADKPGVDRIGQHKPFIATNPERRCEKERPRVNVPRLSATLPRLLLSVTAI